MRFNKKAWPCYIALLASFWLLPLLMVNVGMAALILLLLMPVASFACGLWHGVSYGFSWWLPLMCCAFYLPTIFVYYNYTAWVYVIPNVLIIVAGLGIGSQIRKKHKSI